MDNMRGQESREGQPHNSAAGGRNRSQPPTGFEGMNYEQKRKPYMDGKNGQKNSIKSSNSNQESGERREGV